MTREKRRRRDGSPKDLVEPEIGSGSGKEEKNETGDQQANHCNQESNGAHGDQTGKTSTKMGRRRVRMDEGGIRSFSTTVRPKTKMYQRNYELHRHFI